MDIESMFGNTGLIAEAIAAALVLVLAGAAGGCVMSEMLPGDACARCHRGGSASRFGAAGTVYSSPTASVSFSPRAATATRATRAGRVYVQ